jgi:stage II sporulation protein AA (anti-sigma F factor antagonist)
MARRKKKQQPGFEIEVEHREDGVTRVALSGNSEAVDSSRDDVEGVLQQLLSENRHKILFDTLRLDWFTADVVGALIGDHLRLSAAGGAFIFVGLSDETGPLLEQLGILEFIGHAESVEEAVEWLHQAVQETSDIDPKRLHLKGEKDAGGVRVVTLRGTLGDKEGKRLVKAIRSQIERGYQRIVLDCQTLLDAPGLPYLITVVQEAEQAGAEVVLATLWGIPSVLVNVLGFDALLPIYASREQAVAALSGGTPRKKGRKKRR